MATSTDKDYYQILQVSPTAHADAIEKMFRHFAQRYHPDNVETGDREMFELVVEAHEVLKDYSSRTEYDLRRGQLESNHATLIQDLIGKDEFDSDEKARLKLLSMLYYKCRGDIAHPGMSTFEMMKLLDLPKEHLDFHIWYLKGKGWISRTDEGLLAITVDGVDRAAQEKKDRKVQARIEDRSDDAIRL